MGESQRHHSTVLSHSSSESPLLTLGESINDTEFLNWEMWARSKIPSSSTSMMGMSKLQKESVRAENGIKKKKKFDSITKRMLNVKKMISGMHNYQGCFL